MRADERVAWVDIAKGVAILLVVLNHAALLGVQSGIADPRWLEWNTMLAASRMPLFFFASGLFAGSVVQRPWGKLWSSRLALLVWMFLLWTVIRFTYFTVMPMEARPIENSVLYLVLSPLWPTSGLWFLFALVLFFVITKLTLRFPRWLMLAGATVLSLAFLSVAGVGNIGYNGMARYYLFFLLGMYFKDWVLRSNSRTRPALTAVALLVLIAATAAVYTWRLAEVPGVMVALGLVAVTAGSLFARILAATPLKRPLLYLGGHTLPVYVTHVILVAVAWVIIGAVFGEVGGILAITIPLILVVIIAPISLLLERSVRDAPVLRYLFAVPPFVSGIDREALTRTSSRRL